MHLTGIKTSTLPGLKVRIPWFVVRCLIHLATWSVGICRLSRMFDILFNEIINTIICKKILTLPGLEPGIPSFEVRCLIHLATGPVGRCYSSRMFDILFIEIINTLICNNLPSLPGLEPGIPWFVGRCLIHLATGPVASYISSLLFDILFNEIINTIICNKILTLLGLEPGIPWFLVRCFIHWATGPVVVIRRVVCVTSC